MYSTKATLHLKPKRIYIIDYISNPTWVVGLQINEKWGTNQQIQMADLQ
jgi:hypothetical protein